ncbi:MAG TPA: thermonuclease family protein, partial [bacterium]|nr:thermonuclease family protein [bacterium]
GRFKPSALQARNFNRFMTGGQAASFEFAGEAPAGKEVWGYLFVKEKMANEELLARGLAWLAGTTDELEYADRLRAAEETARIKKAGIWRGKENSR